MRMLELGFTLLGLLLGGLIGEWLGLRPALTIGAVLTIAAGLALLASPARSVRGVSGPIRIIEPGLPEQLVPPVR
jgi:hypothetical protein